jgi:hypothetical protein
MAVKCVGTEAITLLCSSSVHMGRVAENMPWVFWV